MRSILKRDGFMTNMNPEVILEDKDIIFENEFKKIYRIKAKFPGFYKEYFVTDSGPRVGVLVVRGHEFLAVRQYRIQINGISIEIPGGALDDGESLEDAAKRECLEETGVRCKSMEPLIHYHPGLDTICNPTTIFYAHDFVEATTPKLSMAEILQVEWVPISHYLKISANGERMDAMTGIALMSYSLRYL